MKPHRSIPALFGPLHAADLALDLAELQPADAGLMAARIRWHMRTPYAVAIKAVLGEALLGALGLGMVHGGSGWLGDRLVHPQHRSDELEAQLVEALVRALHARGCSSVSALVPAPRAAFFEALGFRAHGAYAHYTGGRCESPTLDEVVLCAPEHVVGLLRLDEQASGEDRRAWITEQLYACQVFVGGGRVLGYYAPLAGDGVVVAANAHAGCELLRWHLPHTRGLWLPEANSAAIAFLEERHYSADARLLRMVRGAPPAWRPELVYAGGGV